MKSRLAPLKIPTGLNTKQVAGEKQRIPSQVFYAVEKPFEIILLGSRNPHRLWFAKYTEYEEAKRLTAEMWNFFKDKKNEHKIEKETLTTGTIVTVKYGTIWYRGKVVRMTGEHLIRVFYVDLGTVVDVGINELRCLPEKFATMPAIAHRGVLCHVQPRDGKWSDESHHYFMSVVAGKKIECKILYRNKSDDSYYIAMRATTIEHGEKKVISDVMINEGYCLRDEEFMHFGVSSCELTFKDYENGYDLKSPCEVIEERSGQETYELSLSLKSSEDDISSYDSESCTKMLDGMQVSPTSTRLSISFELPSSPMPITLNDLMSLQIENTDTIATVSASSSTTFLMGRIDITSSASVAAYIPPPSITKLVTHQFESSPTVFQEWRRRQHAIFMKTIKRADQLKTPESYVSLGPLPTRVATHYLDNFDVGAKKLIYLQSADNNECFYFYIKEEFVDIKNFLQAFK